MITIAITIPDQIKIPLNVHLQEIADGIAELSLGNKTIGRFENSRGCVMDVHYTDNPTLPKTPERLEEIASNDTTIGFLAKELQDLKNTVDIQAAEIHAMKEPDVRLDEGLVLPKVSVEQRARDILERMEIEGAQSFSSGEIVEIANLVNNNELAQRYLFIKSVADHGMLSAMIKSEGLDQLKGSISFNQAIDELINKDTWGKHEGC